MNYPSIFITGTDTDVGKTTISKWLCYHLGYTYFKPIQTGSIDVLDQDTVFEFTKGEIKPSEFIYKAPLAPEQAAPLENKRCDFREVSGIDSEGVLIEGAGGVLVPINEKDTMLDFMAHLKIPVLIVARSTLGTLNHTLLTIKALKSRNIPIIGIVFNGPKNPLNEKTLESFSGLRVLDSLERQTDQMLKLRDVSQDLKEAILSYGFSKV